MMTLKQKEQAGVLERELRDIAGREKAEYKRQALAQSARLLRDLSAQAGWRPIATAPKDGTFVLLAGPSGYTSTPLRVEVGMWDAPDETDSANYKGSWRTFAHDHFTDGGDEPTHWMPLPEFRQEVEP